MTEDADDGGSLMKKLLTETGVVEVWRGEMVGSGMLVTGLTML